MLLLLQDQLEGPVVVSFFFAIEEKDCFRELPCPSGRGSSREDRNMQGSSEWSNSRTFGTKVSFIPSEEGKLTPSGAGGNFGNSISMNLDSTKCIVGAESNKEAYIYS